MNDKLVNLDAQQLKSLLATLVGMGVSEVDADQTFATLVEDNDAEEQDVELEFIHKGRPVSVMVKASVSHNAAPVFSIESEENEVTTALASAL